MNIYKIMFSDGSIYVGKTIKPINIRFNQHMYLLRNNAHHSYKMQAKFIELNFVIPTITLLEEVSNDISSNIEKMWIAKFNSFNNGLNCSIGGEGECGEAHPSAKYYLEDYTAILFILATTEWSLKSISIELDVSYSTVCSISAGNSHQYLQNLYPKEYQLMLDKKGTRLVTSQRDKEYPEIVSPTGEVFIIKNASKFAKDNNLLDSELSNLLNYKSKIHRGWHLLSQEFPKVLNPSGDEYIIYTGKAKEFALSVGLDPSNFTKLLRGASKSCKGWKLLEASKK